MIKEVYFSVLVKNGEILFHKDSFKFMEEFVNICSSRELDVKIVDFNGNYKVILKSKKMASISFEKVIDDIDERDRTLECWIESNNDVLFDLIQDKMCIKLSELPFNIEFSNCPCDGQREYNTKMDCFEIPYSHGDMGSIKKQIMSAWKEVKGELNFKNCK